jgi:hypothetical protein
MPLIPRKRTSQLSERRRPSAYNAVRMIEAKLAALSIKSCMSLLVHIFPIQSDLVKRMKAYLKHRIVRSYDQYITARFVENEELDNIVRRVKQNIRARIEDLVDATLLKTQYRFKTQNQLRRLIGCFQIPEWIYIDDGSRFHREEALLIFLKVTFFPNQLNVVAATFHRNSASPISKICNWMSSFFIKEWGYLITNNMRYWTPLLPICAEAIRQKLAEKTGQDIVKVADDPENGFKIAAMLDFTTVYTCAPGTGPIYPGGPGAARLDPDGLQQQAAYSGYYAHHGMKVMTSSLPNGMDYFVHFPVLLPRSETVTLAESQFLEISNEAQEDILHLPYKYRFHADSNFILFDHELLSSGGLNSIRIYQEHTYRDLKMICKSLNYRANLKMNASAVGRMVLVSVILRNAFNCMNYGQVSVYFTMRPPTLDHWTSQGRKAFPLRNEHVHANEFVLENGGN